MTFSLSRSAGRLGTILSAALFLATTVPARQTPVFHTQTDLVQIPVTVTNADGEFLRGLKRDDFLCTVDGKPVVIRNLDVVRAPSSLPPLTETGPNVYSNQLAARPAQRLVLLIDYDHTPLTDLPNLRLQLKKWFKQPLPPGLEVAVFALNGGIEVLQPFTHDVKLLDAAVDGMVAFHAHGEAAASLRYDLQLLDAFEAARSDPTQGPGGLNDPSTSGTTDDRDTSKAATLGSSDIETGPGGNSGNRGWRDEQNSMMQDQYRDTMQALLQLAGLLEGVPGRKPVIWLTTQTSLEVAWNPDEAISSDARDIAFARLNEANIALFPLDVDGLTMGPFMTDAAKQKLAPRNATDGRVFTEIGIDAAAAWTGGRPFLNTNGFTNVFDKVVELNSESYVLSFAPPPALKGHPYRQVQVKLAHQPHGVELMYRRQYLQPELALAERRLKGNMLQQIRRAALTPMELGGVLVAAHVVPHPPDKRTQKGGKSVDFALLVPYTEVLHDHVDGGDTAGFDFTCFRVLVPMDDPGQVQILKPWRFRQQMTESNAEHWRQQAAVYHSRIDAPPGHLYLARLIVLDNLTGKMGTTSFRMDTRKSAKGKW